MQYLNTITIDAVQDCLQKVPATDYMIVDVNQHTRIDQFVTTVTGKPYIKGGTFYQLSKKELIQKNKLIYIQDKATGIVFQGEYARMLLGLTDTNCTVVPNSNTKYNIFIQSTSLNRKLYPGSKLLILSYV